MPLDAVREARHNHLREAQAKADRLFSLIEAGGLIRAGVTEHSINQEVYDLAFETFGIRKYWHKRSVRAGKNTLFPYRENPPDLTLQSDDIVFLDFGPIFEDWEADFGRTFVLGNDPRKLKLAKDTEAAWSPIAPVRRASGYWKPISWIARTKSADSSSSF